MFNILKKICLLISILIFSCTPPTTTPKDKEHFENRIKEIYNFYPSEVSFEVIEEKSRAMDDFWNLCKSSKRKYLPLLREKLKQEGNNRFFYFDGSSLLLTLSTSKEDMEIAAQAISKSNLKDIQPEPYFHMVHFLAANQMDVYPAIENILNAPNFKIFVPQHFLTLGQDYSVLYCLLPMNEILYLDRLIQRLNIEKNTESIKTILQAIAFTVTEKGQNAIKKYADTTKDPELLKSSQYYLKLENKKALPEINILSKRKHFDDFLNDLIKRNYESKKYYFETYMIEGPYLVRKEDYHKIKQARKTIARRKVSDENLKDIQYLTELLQYAFTSED